MKKQIIKQVLIITLISLSILLISCSQKTTNNKINEIKLNQSEISFLSNYFNETMTDCLINNDFSKNNLHNASKKEIDIINNCFNKKIIRLSNKTFSKKIIDDKKIDYIKISDYIKIHCPSENKCLDDLFVNKTVNKAGDVKLKIPAGSIGGCKISLIVKIGGTYYCGIRIRW